MIFVVATIETVPGRHEEFLRLFRELVPKVLAEEGCLEYAPMVDLPTSIEAQPAARPGVVTVVEQWASLDALEAHLIAPHMIAFRRSSEPMRAGVALQVLQPA